MRPARALLFLVSTLLSTTLLVAVADLAAHALLASRSGLNVWGYRGPVVGRKAPGERRIVVLGGSTAFGYGVRPDEAWPARLEAALRCDPRGWPSGLLVLIACGADATTRLSVVNLAYNNEGAYAYARNLEDYAWLAPDLVILYTGVNDAGGVNRFVLRRQSPIFRATGYLPLLPLKLREAADLLWARVDRPVFWPARAPAPPAASASPPAPPPPAASAVARPPFDGWTFYLDAIAAAVRVAQRLHAATLVVGEPCVTPPQAEQQHRLQRVGFGTPKMPGEYLDLGHAVDVRDPAVAYDGMHLTPAGHAEIARQLAPVVRRMLSGASR